MSRYCPCRDQAAEDGTRRQSRRCLHLVPSWHDPESGPALPPERLLALEAVVATLIDVTEDSDGSALLAATLIDAAEAFDADGLAIDAECAVHGKRAVSDAECSCLGQRLSASEFVQWLLREIRIAGQHDRAGMKHEHESAGALRRWEDRIAEAVGS